MTFVLDASVAAAWLLSDEQSAEADEVLAMIALDGARAPSLLWYEIRKILVMTIRRGRLAEGEATVALARLRRLSIETVDMTLSDDGDVLGLADRFQLTSTTRRILLWREERRCHSRRQTRPWRQLPVERGLNS